MIMPNSNLHNLVRESQPNKNHMVGYNLNMNEYVPFAEEELYEKLFKKLTPSIFSEYPHVNTSYKKISQLIGVSEKNIVLTNGSDGVIVSVLRAFCKENDLIGFIEPTYAMYSIYAKVFNLKTKCVTYNNNLEIREETILDAINPTVKVFIIANPNGIFGNILSESTIERILKKANNTGTIILLDEVYAAFFDGGKSKFIKYINKYDNLIIARSFSKSYGLAGIRAGYSISNEETRKYLYAVRNNVEINSLAVEAISVWCSNPQLLKKSIKEINESREYIFSRFKNLGIRVKNSYANFILVEIYSKKDKTFENLLITNNFLIKILDFNEKRYLRITVGKMKYMRKIEEIADYVYRGVS